MSIEKLQVMMQPRKENLTINRHKEKPYNTRQSITRGESLSLYGIERQKARVTKREHESVNRVWEGETQETYGKKPNTEKNVASDAGKNEIELRETYVEINEETTSDGRSRYKEQSPKTQTKKNNECLTEQIQTSRIDQNAYNNIR